MADAKRLVKNTLYMYARMILIMIVSIYASRVVLDKLGIDDYGLYNAVASIVAMVIFLNATLSTSTSRFLTYDLGLGNVEKLKITFSTSFYTHLILAGFLVVLLETIGLWYMGHKFVIPEGRKFAVMAVYQISIIAMVISVIQVPYTASIMAHENMDIYAYVGIFDAFSRLGILYLLSISPYDKLVAYASLLAFVQILVTAIYIIVSVSKYPETHLVRHFSRNTFREMMGFTGWTAVANLSNTVKVQGATVLLNLFFVPAIIAAKALADQVTQAVMQFINNFRVALNPQIIKSFAAGDFEEFKKWSLRSTVISSDLLLILGLPCIITMKAILDLWLIEVPPSAIEFTQLALLSQIIGSISSSTYIPFVATGRLKINAIVSTFTGIGYFVVLYLLFYLGGGALWVQWLYLFFMILSVFWLQPFLLHKEIGFSYGEVYKCISDCFKPIIVASFFSYVLSLFFGKVFWHQALLFIIVFFLTCLIVWLFLEPQMRSYVVFLIRTKVFKTK